MDLTDNGQIDRRNASNAAGFGSRPEAVGHWRDRCTALFDWRERPSHGLTRLDSRLNSVNRFHA